MSGHPMSLGQATPQKKAAVTVGEAHARLVSAEAWDYIIVGAGAAGCVLASRLSADPEVKVLLLEAGEDHLPGHEHPSIRDPYPVSLGYSRFCWPNLTAEVGPDLGNGQPRLSRQYLQGLGIGGGSNIQGMVALRGFPQDYDDWQSAGAAGWGWEDVLPYFRRLERDLDFDGPLHGRDGPIPIRRIKPEDWAPFAKAFAQCAHDRGYPLVEDFNADFRAGVGPLPMANLPDRRVSASMGYLDKTVRRRSNLTIRAEAHVERIELNGRKVIGVTARTDRGREFIAGHELIVSAGALHSPAILMRSGIGPAEQLRDHAIEVICNLPAVGQHLMNHVNASIAAYLPRHAVQPSTQRGFGQNCLQFSSGVEGSDIDILMVAVNKASWHRLGRRVAALAVEIHKTYSRGEVRLRSADPAIAPEVKFNLLSDERDLARFLVGFKLCLQIAADPRMAWVMNEVFLPNGKWVAALSERNAWNAFRSSSIAAMLEVGPLRRKLLGRRLDPQSLLSDANAWRQLALERANPPHHVSGTCRMGRSGDRGAVVDAHCRVFGVENLRVVDASIMPSLVRANTHLPVLMIAEKMADVIKLQRRSRTHVSTPSGTSLCVGIRE